MTVTFGSVLLYALKSACISAVLCGYYWLFLRNRAFHRYNRIFLLSTAVLAVALPLVPLPRLFIWTGMEEAPVLSGALHSIVPGDWIEGSADARGLTVGKGGWEWTKWIAWGYVAIAAGLTLGFFRQLVYIVRLHRKYTPVQKEEFTLFMTKEPGTPFSFLRAIFWHDQLDTESVAGRQILRHELVHVRQRHTLDLLLLRVLLVVFWFNPVFYLVYRELRTIHEFEADQDASAGGDRYAYAELLVWQTLDVRPGLLHCFFSSSIKRRITMITQLNAVVKGRTARWMALPVFILLLCGFSHGVRPVEKRITVVIDAGHGGVDDGAITSTGLREKNINLSLARKVKALAAEYNVDVVLTRDADELAGGTKSRQASLHYRADLAEKKKADLFISLHTDAGSGLNRPGFHIYICRESLHYTQSTRLGGTLLDALKASYTTDDELLDTKEHVWVLRAATVPAVLILCGNLDNERDRAFISDAANQDKIARDILEGIVHYQH